MTPGRNEPCPCGSQQRYKLCCGRLEDVASLRRADPAAGLPTVERARLATLLDGERYAELEAAAAELLEQQPDLALLWQLLGVARGRQNKDPLPALERAVRCAPEDATAHLNLGNALGRAGRLEEAAGSYQRALGVDPEFAEAHSNLGALWLEFGLADQALASCHQALRIRPDFAPAHQNLAKVLIHQGRFEEAVRSCQRAIALDPGIAEAHNTLGNAWLGLARVPEALASFQRALELNPHLAEAHANVGRALRSIGRLEEAVAGYRRALLLKPDLAQAHTGLAGALRLQRRSDEAEQSCRRALELEPRSATAFTVMAELRADAGHFAEAEELFSRALSMDPASPEAWLGLSRVRRMTPADEAWLAAMRRLAQQPMPPQRELLLRYAIGKHLEDLGEFDAAFSSYQRANDLAKRCGPQHDRASFSSNIGRIIQAYDPHWLNRQRPAVHRSARPVFIVGMLRSGTTLAEHILASHPQVFGAGEQTFWSEVTAAALSAPPRPDGATLRMSDAVLADLGDRYLQALRELSPQALRVVDKLPTNFLSLGLIHAALPGARIIHLTRDPLDTCLSIYFQHFEAANTYTHDLGDLAHYYQEYRRLMEHWRAALPAEAILQVPYEGLVEDLPTWTRRMLEFIGVRWDASCLDFTATSRAVVTASKWQVRQRLFTSSVGRWRHYAHFLAPLMPLKDLAA